MTGSASKFYWASIGGADPEPVEVTTLDGKRVAYTLGCPDPFPLGKRSHVKLGRVAREWGGSHDFFTVKEPAPMERPEVGTAYQENRERDRIEWERRPLPQHSWRGPR